MNNLGSKLAEKIGILVEGGNVYVDEINIQNQSIRPRNELLLLQQVEQEVNSRLAQSLHNHVFVTLDKEAHPEQVNRPWDTEIKIGAKPAEPIPSDTSILTVFEQPEIAGKMLILGNPGAGKTTTMLDLAKELVKEAIQDKKTIPVLVNLSSWTDPCQSMSDWLVEELKSKYGVRKDIGKKWLEDKQLLPILDGLDEVKPESQESCVKAINLWLEGDLRPISIVVCSRREEYENYQVQLNLNGAILLQALTDEQIKEFLSKMNRAELWQLLQKDMELLDLARAPLFLSIIILSYAELTSLEWQARKSKKQRIKLLLDAYIQSMFRRKLEGADGGMPKSLSQEQTKFWMSVLARQMQRWSQTEFLIEKMQPSMWLLSNQKRFYRLLFGLLFGLNFMLINGLLGGMLGALNSVLGGYLAIVGLLLNGFWMIVGLICGLAGGLTDTLTGELTNTQLANGLIYALIYGLSGLLSGTLSGILIFDSRSNTNEEIVLVEKIVPSFKRPPTSGLSGLVFGGLSGLMVGGLNGLLICGMVVGLICWLNGGITAGEVDIKSSPNQGIWKSAGTAFCRTVIYGLIYGLTYGLVSCPIYGLIAGLLGGLLSGLLQGGYSCIQHFILRLMIFHSGSIPWNYARFLNYCTERLFLQRVGGRYRFIHRLLQEHFAEMK